MVTYTLTVANHGPSDASNVVVEDTLPQGTRSSDCSVDSEEGSCTVNGQTITVSYATIPNQESRTAAIVVRLDSTIADGTEIANTATVVSAATDPEPANNASTATITVRVRPHTLRFYSHGPDAPGTATGFTMNVTPAAAQPLTLNLLNAPRWFSDPPLTGTFGPDASFELVRPCTIGLGVLVSYRLTKTDLNGGAEQLLGQTSRPLGLCVGQERIPIDVATPLTVANERLRLTISSTAAVNLTLQLGPGTYLDATDFVGVP